jgi:error-prone DNA polymerase
VRLTHELGVIERAGLANYFLIVWDLVRFAREQGILCQGRGSAANSLVAYLLGITPIDPLAHDLVFERFLSAERQLTPDIDLDFQADRREEVIQYVYRRYGPAHTAMACTFVTFRARSALRDIGKALGLPLQLVDQTTKSLDFHPRAGTLAASLDTPHNTPLWEQLLDLCRQIDHLPRPTAPGRCRLASQLS